MNKFVRVFIALCVAFATLAGNPFHGAGFNQAEAGLLKTAIKTGAFYLSTSLIRRALIHATFAGREVARRKLYDIILKAPELAPRAVRLIEGMLKSPSLQSKINGPGGARLMQEEIAPMLSRLRAWSKPEASNTTMKNIVSDLFRPGAKIGNGSTADAVRHELATGLQVGGKTHSGKAQLAIDSLSKRLKDPLVTQTDKATAKVLIQDLANALRGR